MTFKGKKALVCGASGFLGTHTMLRLLKEGATVRATHLNHQPKVRAEGVEFIKADLRDLETCKKVCEGMDYVFMCSAATAGAAVMTETPLAHVTPNVVMNTHMLEAAYKAGVKKFLFISSGAAYPDTGMRPVREDEMFSGEPVDVYYAVAWMKRYTEILCRTYADKIKNPMPTVIIRPSNVYGPYDKYHPNNSHVTAALIRRVATRENPMNIWGTGGDIRDLIFIDDFMDGMMLAFEQTGNHLAINIASGTASTVKEVLYTAMEVDGYKDAVVNFDITKPQTVPVRLIDASLAKKLLGFEAKTDLKTGLKKTLDWFHENQDFALAA